jgi:hypothetical protein
MLTAINETLGDEWQSEPSGSPGEPQNSHGHCTACFSGEYPIRVPPWLFAEDRDKLVFETVWG